MKLNLVGPFTVNAPFGTEIAFAKGLRKEGHTVVEVDPNLPDCVRPDPSADATVVFKSCVGREAELLGNLKHPIVTYQPDDARFPHIREMMLMMREHSDLFLSFDGYGARLARDMRYRDAEVLLLTADPELYCPSPDWIERDIDVSFIGSLGDPVAHASRRKMIQIVQTAGSDFDWNCAFYNTQDIPAVLEIYRRSKVVINHATDVGQPFGYGFGLQCRHFEVGMTGTTLVSNTLLEDVPGQPLSFYQYFDGVSLVSTVSRAIQEHWLTGPCLYEDIVTSHMPHHRAAQMVDFIGRNS